MLKKGNGYFFKIVITYCYHNSERMINMALAEITKTAEPTYTINDAMGCIVRKT